MAQINFEFTSQLLELQSLGERAIDFGIKNGATQIEISLSNGFTRSLEYKNSSISGIQQQSNNSLTIRAYNGKKLGTAKATSLAQNTMEEMVHSAIKLSKLSPPDDNFHSLPDILIRKPAEISNLFDPEVANFDPEEFIAYAKAMIDGASSAHEQVNANGSISTNTNERVVVNSLGVNASSQSTSFSGFARTTIPLDPTNVGVGGESHTQRGLGKPEDLIAIGEKSGVKAKQMLNAKSGPSGVFPVLLSHRATRSSLGSLIGMGVNGFSVMMKTSYFADKLGEEIGISSLKMWDDPHISGGSRASTYDSEGVPTTRVELIDDGVLKSYLTDSYTAFKLGVENTGSAVKMRGMSRPSLRQVQIAEGSGNSIEMLEDMKEGLYMESGVGGMFNRGSPNISNKIDRGFYVKNGEIQYPIKNSMLGTNVFDFLKNITTISKDVVNEFGYTSPSILVDGIDIGGAKEKKEGSSSKMKMG